MSSDDDDTGDVVRAPDPSQWSNSCELCFEVISNPDDWRQLPCGCAHAVICASCANHVATTFKKCSFCATPIKIEDVRPLLMVLRNMLREGGRFCKKCRTFIKEPSRSLHRCASSSDNVAAAAAEAEAAASAAAAAAAAASSSAEQASKNVKKEDDQQQKEGEQQQEEEQEKPRPVVDANKNLLGERVESSARNTDVIEPSRTEVVISQARSWVGGAASVVGAKISSAASSVSSAAATAWSNYQNGGSSGGGGTS